MKPLLSVAAETSWPSLSSNEMSPREKEAPGGLAYWRSARSANSWPWKAWTCTSLAHKRSETSTAAPERTRRREVVVSAELMVDMEMDSQSPFRLRRAPRLQN